MAERGIVLDKENRLHFNPGGRRISAAPQGKASV
jgi:hypothetical protein